MRGTDETLPFPFDKYEIHKCLFGTFDEYSKRATECVKKSTMNVSIIDRLNYAVKLYPSLDENMVDWICNHTDKIRYIFDFSYLCFGVEVIQRMETIRLRYPQCVTDRYVDVYDDQHNYHHDDFIRLSNIEKLEWMYENCEFIPFRTIHETIGIFESHRFSHIKTDSSHMKYLSEYLSGLKYPPNDNVYYFINVNNKGNYYLKRDLAMSPRKDER